MTILQMEYFIEASKTLSFTKTAEKFYISQSAVTQQIKNLEDELGVLLFQRRNNRITLTPAGELFVQEATSLLAKTKDVIEKVQAVHNGLNGTLKIGYLQCMEMNRFPQSIQSFHSKYPSVKLNLYRGGVFELRDMLMDGRLDVIFNIDNENIVYSNTDVLQLRRYDYSVVVPATHPLAEKSMVQQSDLHEERLIIHNLHRKDSTVKDPIPRKFLRDEFLNNVIATENDVETIMIMVTAGIGIAVLPNCDIGKMNADMQLRAVPLNTNGYQALICEYHLKDNTNPIIPLFLDELV